VRALVLIIIILFAAVKLNTKYIYLISHVSADYWVVDIPGLTNRGIDPLIVTKS
jgi:hypothetical protein